MEVLYSSQEIADCIKRLFKNSRLPDRRVALVAYIGKDYAKYLPNPRGLYVVCSPTPGATSPIAISELLESGAKVQFSNKLHMKVYWSNKNGCLITSANLSQNALGVRGLKEAGVLVDAKIVKIDRLIRAAKPYQVTSRSLRRLKDQEAVLKEAQARTGKRYFDGRNLKFSEWFQLPPSVRENWRLDWWADFGDPSEAAKEFSRNQYGKSEPEQFLDITRAQKNDKGWLLTFRISGNNIGKINWTYVHHVAPVRRNERGYDRDYPFQALQALPLSRCPEPPFATTPSFKKSFKRAIKKYGMSKFTEQAGSPPSARLLAYIDNFERKQ